MKNPAAWKILLFSTAAQAADAAAAAKRI